MAIRYRVARYALVRAGAALLLLGLLSGCSGLSASNAANASSTSTTSANTSSASPTVRNVPAARCGDPIDYSSVPATPTAIPGPMAAYVKATVASGTGQSSATTRFQVNSQVHALIQVQLQGAPSGQTHTVTVQWYLDGQQIQLPLQAGLQQSFTGNAAYVNFGLTYPSPGVGRVQVYLDQPISDATLAQSLTFGIYC